MTIHSRITGSAGVAQRRRIRLRDNYTCQNPTCRRAVRVGEVDHKIPLEKGGSNDDDNLWLLCNPCHKIKTASDRGYILKTGIAEDGMPTANHHHWNR
jgi:5-methylcytosine-specific restriction protein A